jgi:hypothetical protein
LLDLIPSVHHAKVPKVTDEHDHSQDKTAPSVAATQQAFDPDEPLVIVRISSVFAP